jgi:predicted TIM-barrel fold metal-dependent hydrolase
MNVTDFHTHIFPDRVADRALQTLVEAYQAAPQGPATVAGVLAAMDAAGIAQAVVCPVATRPDQVTSINRWVTALDRERFIPFGALHPDFPGLREELAFLRDQGVRGLKLQPHFQGYAVEDAALLRMFEHLEDFVVLMHGGQEIKPIPFVPTTPERLRALHDRFPRQRLVIAHLGGYQMWEGVEEYLLGQDLYFDLSFTFDRLNDATIARLVAAHGPEQILFGSDYPWMTPAQARAGVERMPWSEEEKRGILGGNAKRLLGIGL